MWVKSQKNNSNVLEVMPERFRQIEEIKKLVKQGHQIKWGSHNWFELGNKTFNGFTKELVNKILNNEIEIKIKVY